MPEPESQPEAPIRIELLGGFAIEVAGAPVVADAWPGRRSVELVQLLALSENNRLPRDQVLDALWPHLDAEGAGANLRKAAHHARKALGNPDGVRLRSGVVALFPGFEIETDASGFEARAADALQAGDTEACAAVAAGYAGDLLPDARYEEWAEAPRVRLRALCTELLRAAGDWERIVELDPLDEEAYRQLMRAELDAGRRPGAIRWYGRLRSALRRDLGITPDPQTRALYDECVEGLATREPDYVGRQLELARLTAALRSAKNGDVALVAIRGSAGMGKSALCRQLTELAPAEGWTVVSTRASEVGDPYAPLAEAVEALGAAEPEWSRDLGARSRSILERLASPDAGGDDDPKLLTRHQVISVLRLALRQVGRGQPVALVVDDAHLADDATLDVLQHLPSMSGSPVIPVLGYRAEEAPAILRRAVARLARGDRAVEIDLEPLEDDAVSALVLAAAHVPRTADVASRIADLAQGNPFLVLELARSAVAGVPALVPTARDAIASRFLDLDDRTLSAMRRLALTGDDLAPGPAAAVIEADEPRAFRLLDAGLTHGVLILAEGRYRFRHELVRQALIDQIAPQQRRPLHREIATLLEGAGASPGLIASHWLAGEDPNEAVRWLFAAARHAVGLGAYRDALAHLDSLLDRSPEDIDGLRLRAEALDALGDRRALAAYTKVASLVGDPEAADLKAKQGLAQIKMGDPPGGLRVIEGIEPRTPEGKLAHALALAGAAALGYADPALGTEKAAEARRLALETGDEDAAVVASWAQAAAAHARGELRSSVMADLIETSALPKLAVSVFDGQLCITQRLLYGARPYSDVIAFADEFVAQSMRLGAARGHAFGVTIRGEAKLLAGSLDEAEADLIEGARLHREIGAASGEAFALQRRAEVAFHRGDRTQATTLLDEALTVAGESDVGFHLLDRIYGTRIMIAATDAESALAAIEEAEAAVRGPVETCPGCRITLAFPAALAAAKAGDIDLLGQWEADLEFLANTVMRLPAWTAALEEVRAHRARLTGEHATALRRFRTAAAGYHGAGQPLDEARCEAELTRTPEAPGSVEAGAAAAGG